MRSSNTKRVVLGCFAALFMFASTGSALALTTTPANNFLPVYLPLYEQIKKLKKGTPTTQPKQEELSVMEYSSHNHIYTILRYCMPISTENCLVSFYRDEIRDENFFGAAVLPAFSSYWETQVKLCEHCAPAHPISFHYEDGFRDSACSITIIVSDEGVLQYLGCPKY
ncbi:hypothetical protein [Hoeflea poritis]|uniref:Uncharacterized protein n=1 Tax=Hoeflea poritis TaxID=2993659 RepID=A0ABT4VH17_9HYPH|nr:hypothetical protein [Hoeflea poritis]MDA4843992.1 hypothetical protein [Hoeflea poritis]